MKSLSLAATAALAVAAPALAEKTVVTADRDLDVATGRYVEQPAILVGDDGRITAIADARRNSVTRSAASATKDVGAIAVGRFGDMVAVTGDPTGNLRLLETVDAVVKGGKLVVRAPVAAGAR